MSEHSVPYIWPKEIRGTLFDLATVAPFTHMVMTSYTSYYGIAGLELGENVGHTVVRKAAYRFNESAVDSNQLGC